MPARILIADDDVDLTMTLADRLQAAGFETIVAHEGVRVLEAVHRQKPQLIILDWKMPAGEGSSILESLAKKEETRRIPIILLSGMEDPSVSEKALKLGVKAFIKKPYETAELMKVIQEALNHGG